MQANGVNFDQYLKVQGQTVEEFRAWLHTEAERKLRSRMGLLLVAQREQLWPTEAEVEEELAHWDDKRDGEHTFPSNDRRRAAQRIASSRAAQFRQPGTSVPSGSGASVVWVTVSPSVDTASTRAPPSVPVSQGWPPPSGKKAVRPSTTAKPPGTGVQLTTCAVKFCT